MHVTSRLQIIICLLISVSTVTHASEREKTISKQAVIEQIANAYGGNTLISMKSIIVHDRYKTITANGGVKPGLDAISQLHSTLTVDFELGRKSVKNWSINARGKRLGQIMFDGESGWSINYLRGSHVLRPDLNQHNVGAGMMRLLDTTVVRSLLDAGDLVNYEGYEYIGRKKHHKLSFKINGKTDVTIYVNSSTGLINQMTQPNGSTYIYSDHKKSNGITYASDTNQLRDGKAVMLTYSRTIEVNPIVSTAFTLPKSTKALEGMRDNSKLVVNKLDDDVYIAGLGNRSSLFVDAGDHYVAVGNLPGFKKRLQAVNDVVGAEKTVKYTVVSEHQGHMGALDELAELGANFVTVAEHVPLLKSRLSQPLADERFVLVEKQRAFANGKVEVFDIQTVTSDQFLLFYVPSVKLVYTMDEFGTNLLNSVPSGDKRTLSLRHAIEALDIDVQQFAYVHGTGILSMTQLKQVTDGYIEGDCPEGHVICSE